MNVGHQSLAQSIRYQAFRYHLISVPLLADEGPFSWIGVPSLLFTDYDFFFDKNPDYNEPTDLAENIDTDALQKSANILSQFLVLPIEKVSVLFLIQNAYVLDYDTCCCDSFQPLLW